MELNLATPALLFPAVSLLLLAYTNRFLTLATLIRNFGKSRERSTLLQIQNMRKRIQLIKRMQEYGVISFFFCVLCMLALYLGYQQAAGWVFGVSLLCLMYSLILSVIEIRISIQALDVHLDAVKEEREALDKPEQASKSE
uniref:DUF2721 domain-containing protein n=1 Tax=Ningiella ruwaisensis TaxID=2364274 RepID=UPI00109F5F87|nr:DUF2721 domain-containing protein [Ningiella ruwaisensis]